MPLPHVWAGCERIGLRVRASLRAQRDIIQIGDIEIEVIRKDIKHLHLAVYPPEGRVRVSAPVRLSDDAVRLAVVPRLGWIRQKQREYAGQERQSQREMVTGESHFVQGRRYRLDVVEIDQRERTGVSRPNNDTLLLQVRPGSDRETRERVLLLNRFTAGEPWCWTTSSR